MALGECAALESEEVKSENQFHPGLKVIVRTRVTINAIVILITVMPLTMMTMRGNINGNMKGK